MTEFAPFRWDEWIVEDVIDDRMEAIAAPVLAAVESCFSSNCQFLAYRAMETVFVSRNDGKHRQGFVLEGLICIDQCGHKAFHHVIPSVFFSAFKSIRQVARTN